MSTLPTLSLIQSHIIELPGRPPAMLAADLAAFYGVTTFQIGRAMKRNPDRFPDDFVFTLTEVETERLRHQNGGANDGNWPRLGIVSQGFRSDLKSQNAISGKARYAPLAFTEIGAYALSGVLKSPRAAEVSVMVFRVFTGLMQAQRRTLHSVASRYRVQRVARDPVARLVFAAVAEGMDFAAIRKAAPKSWTTAYLVQGIHDMLLFGEIAELPAGTPARALAQAEG